MKQKCCIYITPDTGEEDGMRYSLVPEDLKWYMNDDSIMLEETTVNYRCKSLTPELIRLKAIETLKAKQERVVAEAEKKKNHLQEKINNLLRLTCSGD